LKDDAFGNSRVALNTARGQTPLTQHQLSGALFTLLLWHFYDEIPFIVLFASNKARYGLGWKTMQMDMLMDKQGYNFIDNCGHRLFVRCMLCTPSV
jgi:hypothetical protein